MLYKKPNLNIFGKSKKIICHDFIKQRKKYVLCAAYLSWMILFPELLEEWKLCEVSVLENGEWVESSIDQVDSSISQMDGSTGQMDEEVLMEVEYKWGLLKWIDCKEK